MAIHLSAELSRLLYILTVVKLPCPCLTMQGLSRQDQ